MIINTPADVQQLGSILGVWAHPDDESFMMAGLIAAAVQSGQAVACITATKGEEGVQDEAKWPKARLGDIRAAEMAATCKILGLKHHHWLGYWDGKCDQVTLKEGTARVLEYINKYQPATIVTFPPDGLTGHDDHKTVSHWAREATKQSGRTINLLYAVDTQEGYDRYGKAIDDKFNVYFNIDKPVLVPEAKCDIVLRLTPELSKKKLLALKAQPSQTEGMFKQFGDQQMLAGLTTEAFIYADQQNPAKWPI